MFRPVNIRHNITQRIPPYPSSPVFEVIKTKSLDKKTGKIEQEQFDLDSGIYEITITTPVKTGLVWYIQGDTMETSSKIGRIKQVQYNVQRVKCFVQYCNDYINVDETNSSFVHLKPLDFVTQTGSIFSGYGECYIVRTKYDIEPKQFEKVQTSTQPNTSANDSGTNQVIVNGTIASKTTGWHIIAGYNANTIPIDLQKNYFSIKNT